MEAAHADQALDRRGRNSSSGRRPCSNTFVRIDPDHQSVCRRRYVRCHGAAAAACRCSSVSARPIIVENRPGASASIGAAVVAKSPPDGSTWLLTSETFLLSTLLLTNLPFDVQKDFEPVTMIARGPMVLCAHPSRTYRTLPELVAAAKAKPDTLTYGTTGIGSNGHLTVAALCQLTGIKLVHVPYRGAAPLLNDGTAGHVDMVISSSATVAPQVESGQLRALIQFGDQRASFIPDTPDRGRAGHYQPARLFVVRLLRPGRDAEADH